MHIIGSATPESDGSWLGGLVDWTVSLMDVIGPYGAGLAIAIENLFPPIPSEAILPLAGLAAHRGSFALWEAILWTTVGALLGALVLYAIGAALGVERLKWVAAKVPLLEPADIDKTVAWFDKHGAAAVFFGRFVPIFRSLISIPAGVVRMPVWKFVLYSGAGSLIWNTIFIMLGWFLGSSWHIIEEYMDVAQNVVIVVVVILVAWFVVARIRKIRARKNAADAAGQAGPTP